MIEGENPDILVDSKLDITPNSNQSLRSGPGESKDTREKF